MGGQRGVSHVAAPGGGRGGHYGVAGMEYEVVLDPDECVSAGRCVATAPEFFVFDSDELVEVARGAPKLSNDALLRIARACPSGAIKLRLNGNEVED